MATPLNNYVCNRIGLSERIVELSLNIVRICICMCDSRQLRFSNIPRRPDQLRRNRGNWRQTRFRVSSRASRHAIAPSALAKRNFASLRGKQKTSAFLLTQFQAIYSIIIVWFAWTTRFVLSFPIHSTASERINSNFNLGKMCIEQSEIVLRMMHMIRPSPKTVNLPLRVQKVEWLCGSADFALRYYLQ